MEHPEHTNTPDRPCETRYRTEQHFLRDRLLHSPVVQEFSALKAVASFLQAVGLSALLSGRRLQVAHATVRVR